MENKTKRQLYERIEAQMTGRPVDVYKRQNHPCSGILFHILIQETLT